MATLPADAIDTRTQNSASFTPGPWDYFVGNANGRGLIRIEQHGTGVHIASMQRGAVSEANARLAAMSPELLDLARLFKATIEYYIAQDRRNKDEESARMKTATLYLVTEVISKAEGR